MLPYVVGFLVFAGVIAFFITGGIALSNIDEHRDTIKDRRVIPPEDYK